jgi:6,7-dimethyl-8-ribityllumazine synthase
MSEALAGRDLSGRRIAIVASRFNEIATVRLAAGARACLLERGVPADRIDEYWVPGAWELPLAADRLAARAVYDAVVALGCVIRGETPHFDYVSGETARGLAEISLRHGLPVAFGVLTTDDAAQAMDRAGGRHGNKGWEAADAALEMITFLERVARA